MIDEKKYKGHTPGPWESEEWDEGLIVGPISERHGNNHPIVAAVGDGWWGDMMTECNANLRLMVDAPLIFEAYKRLRDGLIAVQRSLIWDEQDRKMDGDPITLEALVAQVEQVRSDITEMIDNE